MATPADKIDSDVTGLSFAEEASIGVLPGSPVWYDLEPNKYSNFGGDIKTLARNPINPSRQLKKGVVVDLDASGGFSTDLTQTNLQRLLQGFFFANLRTKAELSIANVKQSGAEEDYEPASGGGAFKTSDLLFAKGFDSATNNGLKKVSSAGASSVVVATALVAASTQSGTISRVGCEFGTGDAFTSTTGAFPSLQTTTKNLTELGLIPGEFIFLGGDLAAEQFATAASNGFCRVRSVAANKVEFDKVPEGFAADAGTGKTIRLFCGRCLKNETGTSIVRRSYQLERTLGVPDLDLPSQIQTEYLVGAVANEATFNIAPANKLEVDLSLVGTDFQQRTGATGPKSGSHVPVVEASAFNTTSDLSRAKLSLVNGTPLFVYFTDLKLTINNHVTPNKAVGVLGAFDLTAGVFEVNGSLTAYFTDVAGIQAVRNNEDVTLDFIAVKENAGIAFDVPLITLGDGRPDVKQNDPVKLPLSLTAATGAKIDPALNHTLFLCFFDYLPDLAE